MKGAKKKRLISVLLTATMILGTTASMPLSASAVTTQRVESGYDFYNRQGIWSYEYIEGSNCCRITGYNGEMTELEIPKMIYNRPVRGSFFAVFFCCPWLFWGGYGIIGPYIPGKRRRLI